jgi:uncharacterized membrane-anchored protein YjiN (DUF445 family)
MPSHAPSPRHRSVVGTLSLATAVTAAAACRVALTTGPFVGATWLHVLAAGCEAAVVGGLADWFAVTALFRHPLGLPIPHTAIIPARRAKIVEGIASMVQDEWLSPEVIGARLARLSPSQLLIDWLQDAEHVERVGAPLRDLLRELARMLTAPEVVAFLDRALQRQLRELPLDTSAGQWLLRVTASDSAITAFQSAARSLANLARQPGTAAALQSWLDHAARILRQDGRRFVPLLLRRKVVQRTLVEAACDYASREMLAAAEQPDHAVRQWVFGTVRRFAERLARGDAAAVRQVEEARTLLLDSLAARPLVADLLARLRAQLDDELANPAGELATLIDRTLRTGVLDALAESRRRASFDHWVRSTAQDLLERHHDQIGLTVRENLEALETDALVRQIEERVGADLQFIRLNGALVGGLIGILLALAHLLGA